jgi:hypothetical protein
MRIAAKNVRLRHMLCLFEKQNGSTARSTVQPIHNKTPESPPRSMMREKDKMRAPFCRRGASFLSGAHLFCSGRIRPTEACREFRLAD